LSAEFGIASLKMLGSLIIVLGLIIGFFILLARLRLNPLSGSRPPNMRVIGNLSLGPKRSITLVEVCDQWLLLGVGTDSVSLIKELPRLSEDNESEISAQIGNNGFHSLLRGIQSLADRKNKTKQGNND